MYRPTERTNQRNEPTRMLPDGDHGKKYIERGNHANLSLVSWKSDLWWVSFVLSSWRLKSDANGDLCYGDTTPSVRMWAISGRFDWTSKFIEIPSSSKLFGGSVIYSFTTTESEQVLSPLEKYVHERHERLIFYRKCDIIKITRHLNPSCIEQLILYKKKSEK